MGILSFEPWCISTYIYIYTCLHTNACAQMHAHTNTHTHKCMHAVMGARWLQLIGPATIFPPLYACLPGLAVCTKLPIAGSLAAGLSASQALNASQTSAPGCLIHHQAWCCLTALLLSDRKAGLCCLFCLSGALLSLVLNCDA